ncbi:MAG: SIS domain-containing protein, partial [Cyanobacteria bacterium P01_D01_bin.2]
ENYRELREGLIKKGYEFHSETDTEVIPNLIADYLTQGVEGPLDRDSTLLEAVRQTVNRLEGAFALAIVSADFPDELIVVRQQAPLAIGFGQGEFFCASDTPAIVPHTRAVLPLDNGELAMLTPLGAAIYDFTGRRLKKHPITLSISSTMVEKQGFKHFMLKEIHEQPSVVRTCLETYLVEGWTPESNQSPINLGLDTSLLANLEHVQILACGTSWHASLVGKHLLQQLADIPTVVHYASEFRYSATPLIANALTIGVTQSGETADTLAALDMEQTRRREKRSDNGEFSPRMLGITNRPESSLGRLIPNVMATHAGIEVGVAATKTFVAQLMAFYFLALELAYQRQTLSGQQLAEIIENMRQLPTQMEHVIAQQESYTEELAHSF